MHMCVYIFIERDFGNTNSSVASPKTSGLCSAGLFLGIASKTHDPMHHMLCPYG